MKPRLAVVADVDVERLRIEDKRSILAYPGTKTPSRYLALSYPACLLNLLFVMLAPSAAGATGIVIVQTADTITVGADSLAFSGAGTPTRLLCKIEPCGRFFVAWSGILVTRGFDLLQVIRSACANDVSLDQVAADFERIMLEGFPAVIEHDESTLVRGKLAKGEPLVSVAFFGIDDNAAAFVLKEFKSRTTTRVDIQARDIRNPPACMLERWIQVVGKIQDMLPLFRDKDRLRDEKPRALIERFIGVQSDATPESVGGPINIIEVDRALGAQWLHYEQECERIPDACPE